MIDRVARAVAFANEWASDDSEDGVLVLVPLDDGPVPIRVEALDGAGGRPRARLWITLGPADGVDAAACLRWGATGLAAIVQRGDELGLTATRFVDELDPRQARALFQGMAHESRAAQAALGL